MLKTRSIRGNNLYIHPLRISIFRSICAMGTGDVSGGQKQTKIKSRYAISEKSLINQCGVANMLQIIDYVESQ